MILYRFLYLVIFFPAVLLGFNPHPMTPNPVLGYTEIAFFDDDFKQNRQIEVWYPVEPQIDGAPSGNPWDLFFIAKDAPFAKDHNPLIILSHGYTGNPHQLSWLIKGLVYHGFAVAAIQHMDLINGRVHINHWQRAADIPKIIDHLQVSSLNKAINFDQIGFAGFSLGGTTAIWVAGGRSTNLKTLIPGKEYAAPEDYKFADEALPTLNKEMMGKSWHEPRIKAIFVMAPAWAWLFDEESLKKISIPTYLIAAAEDRVLVTRNNAGLFAKFIPQSIYQEIKGNADHFIFVSALSDAQKGRVDSQLNFLFKDDASIDRRWIQFEVAEEAAAFFHSSLGGIPK